MKKSILVLIAIVFVSGAFAQEVTKGSFTDPRDGQVYPTISFENFLLGTQMTWMAKNLDYKMSTGCVAYDNNEMYRKRMGLLYTWVSAKKACPSGWHLPSDNEWNMLVNEFGGYDKAGTALKHKQGWTPNDSPGTNSSGFNALPGGYRDPSGSFGNAGEYGYWWSSSAEGSEDAWRRGLSYDNGKVYRDYGNREYGYSVRCVKD